MNIGMGKNMNIVDVLNVLPHRYPFLLVDRIIDIQEKSVTAIKNVTFNESFFQGHFPGNPVMPGVLILEALAQTGAAVMLSVEGNRGKIAYFVGADNVRFRRMVLPGDVLNLRCDIVTNRSSFGKAKCIAKVGDEIACEAYILFAIK